MSEEEQKKTYSEDEYQFPQDEYSAGFTAEQSQNPPEEMGAAADVPQAKAGPFKKISDVLSNLPKIKNKRVAIIILVVVVLVIFLKVFHTKTPDALPAIKQQPAVAQTPTSTPAPAPKPIAQPIEASVVQSSPDLSALNPAPPAGDSKLKELQGQLTDLQSNLSRMEDKNQSLTQSVSNLTTQVQNLTDEITKILAQEKKMMPKEKKIVYHLRAVVPDRAWITSSSGETMSVTTGDKVAQYGEVVSIDPASGVILTSSGRKIEYGSNDF